ncbi:exonuclease subunit SbcD [Nostocoides sp. F2B08]|uniref:exonuclease SbcCD subunit D n=1 Tax=Nostocoides sp. F2B08 TaxID=2653936 RepID=UPI001263DE7A|nr:exonuclease SbcCD subunit D [Tetrasphaera sp. F2B08]KAB7743010.1 exonuclease subunit SbcD [Tetrasphaera sp. F2B08]
MRFLHTSDWHLGRAFHQVGLLDAQRGYVEHLIEVVRTEHVDAVLIAGDVYDRAMPSPDTVELFSETLVRLVDAGAQVIVSSGNHDSAVRLGFASGLLERAGVHVRTGLGDVARPVVVRDTAVYPIPYLEPRLVAPILHCSPTHTDVLTTVLAMLPPAGLVRGATTSVVMAHTFVTGCATTDSERDILSGGLGAVHPDVFAGYSYVALGHLHGRQQVAETTRYSGSPVAMSFSEVGHTKGSLLVDLDPSGARVQTVEAPVHRRIATLRGELDELLTSRAHAHAETAWCQITLTDAHRPLGAMDRLRSRFPHTLELRFEPSGGSSQHSTYTARVAARTSLDVCCDFLSHVRGGTPTTSDETGLFEEALGRSRETRAATRDEGQVGAA